MKLVAERVPLPAGQCALSNDIGNPRLLAPDARMWAEAGMLSGIAARTQDFQAHQSKKFLADALVYLCAARRGLPVITSDRDDYDILQQVVSTGRVYAYV